MAAQEIAELLVRHRDAAARSRAHRRACFLADQNGPGGIQIISEPSRVDPACWPLQRSAGRGRPSQAQDQTVFERMSKTMGKSGLAEASDDDLPARRR